MSWPQVFWRDTQLHHLLARFEALTGPPALTNASVELHEEPIVRTPEEAPSTYVSTGLNRMVRLMEDLLAERG